MVSTAVDLSARASVVGIQTNFVQIAGSQAVALPQRVAVVGQGNEASTYSTTKAIYTRASDVGAAYGYGSPLHLAAQLLRPENGDGLQSIPMTIYPLESAGGALAAEGTITPVNAATATGSYRVSFNGKLSEAFTVAPGDTVAAIIAAMETAINAVLDVPVIATDDTTELTITSKWLGESANDISVEVIGPTLGVTFTVVQPTGGATNPDVQDALDQFGEVWETLVVNCLNVQDEDNLDTYQAFGEGRWGALVRRPLVVFTGLNLATVGAATAISSTRTLDRINSQIPAPGSVNLPLQIAARAVCRIAQTANNKPANDYLRKILSGLEPGPDGDQWDYADRDQAVKAGSSTTKTQAGEILTEDTRTFYFPVGDPNPAYGKVCTIVKLMQVLYGLDRIFTSDRWAGAPLIPDFQVTTNPDAMQPKDAIAEISVLLDQLGSGAIISDPETAKQTIVAQISGSNPDRLDVAFTVQIGGNTNIVSVDLNFGFYFG